MFRILFLLFLIVPAIEIALFIEIGGVIGVPWTLLLIVVTAALGVVLLRIQGLMTLMRVQDSLNQGRLPALEMIEGMMLLVSGAFLLTPGFFTDALGFAVLTPAIRRWAARWLLSHVHLISGGRVVYPDKPKVHREPDGHHTIEGEFRRED